MKHSVQTRPLLSRIGFNSLLLALGWSCAVIASLLWNLHLQNQETYEVALNVARTHLENENLYRRWNVMQGGVYVPVTAKISPNPLLRDIPERDITTPSGRHLTLASHADMIQQMRDELDAKSPVTGRITSLKPLSPANRPDAWEADALAAFAGGKNEAASVVTEGGWDYLRLMRPFIIEKGCLKCHEHQGHAIGDVFGGIDVKLPMALSTVLNAKHVVTLYWGHLVWWLLGVLGIGFSYTVVHKRIKERDSAEVALKQVKGRLERILSATGEGIYGVDQDGNISFVNPTATRLLGFASEELIGMPCHRLCHGPKADNGSLADGQCFVSESYRQGIVHTGAEDYYRRKDGSFFLVVYSSMPIIESDKLLGAVVTFSDITERKRVEEEMAAMRLYFQNVIDSMPSVLIGVDLAGEITQWNREAERVAGFNSEAVKGRLLNEVCPGFSPWMDRIRMAIQERGPLRMERTASPVHPGFRYADIMIYPLFSMDIEGAVIRVDDITERVRLEDRMIQSEKMITVAGLVEGMAHEINNPLGGIIQGAQSILRRVSIDIPRNYEVAESCGTDLVKIRAYMQHREIFKFLEGMRNAGRQAAEIIHYMLQFSSETELATEERNLAEIINHSIKLIAKDQALKGKVALDRIQFVTDLDPHLPEVLCSVSRIETVLLNLFKNAIQVLQKELAEGTNPAPRIIIRTRMEDTMARIEVEDNGPGMDEETRKRVFEPFFTTRPPGEGTGIGLTVSYFIITVAHQGNMSVESAPGAGAKFIFRLPLA